MCYKSFFFNYVLFLHLGCQMESHNQLRKGKSSEFPGLYVKVESYLVSRVTVKKGMTKGCVLIVLPQSHILGYFEHLES